MSMLFFFWTLHREWALPEVEGMAILQSAVKAEARNCQSLHPAWTLKAENGGLGKSSVACSVSTSRSDAL